MRELQVEPQCVWSASAELGEGPVIRAVAREERVQERGPQMRCEGQGQDQSLVRAKVMGTDQGGVRAVRAVP